MPDCSQPDCVMIVANVNIGDNVDVIGSHVHGTNAQYTFEEGLEAAKRQILEEVKKRRLMHVAEQHRAVALAMEIEAATDYV